MKETKEAAIFDVDKTIVRGNTGQMYVMHFFFRGLINPLRALQINYYVLRYMLNNIDYDKAMRQAYKATRGWKITFVKQLIRKHYQKKVRGFIYRDMRKIIEKHRQEGRLIVFVTNSWDVMVTDIADELRADHLIATEIGQKAGRFTGEVISPNFAEHKRKNIKELAKRKGIDLQKSYAYSDHISDVPMLETVGHPVAVNPDKRLLSLAEKKGWKVLYPR